MDEPNIADERKIIQFIEKQLKPLQNIPLRLVIRALSGYEIIPFNKNDEKDQILLKKLVKVAQLAAENINKVGIITKRPNEVGNAIEKYVKEALNKVGFSASTPFTATGKKKATGYPDIEFVDDYGRTNYLECKTHNKETIHTSQRTFYLSPSSDFKVTKNAHHLVLSYEIYESGQISSKRIYKCRSWKILSIANLLVDIKYEFNSDNKRLYSTDLILQQSSNLL